MIDVLVADDHPVVREGLASIINSAVNCRCIETASNASHAVKSWCALSPDVGVFDLRMRDADGVAAIGEIVQSDPRAKIIIVSSFANEEDVYRAAKAGASGYLLKDTEPEILLEAIQAVASGGKYFPAELSALLAKRLASPDLSRREIEVLQLAARGGSNEHIARTLAVSVATVKFHLKNTFTKLGVRSRIEAINEGAKRGVITFEP